MRETSITKRLTSISRAGNIDQFIFKICVMSTISELALFFKIPTNVTPFNFKRDWKGYNCSYFLTFLIS